MPRARVRFGNDPHAIAVNVPLVQGASLDLVQEGLERRLRFDNPNARSTCGCGESFHA